jgi:Ni/Co efflux regulator RcnB
MIPLKHSHRLLALAMAAALAAGGPALAARAAKKDKDAEPPAAEKMAPGGQARYGVKLGAFFTEQHKKAARRLFAQRYGHAKDCPPGMERGDHGCAPPVPGRYWAVGQPLQPAVKEYLVPDVVISKLPTPPEGYRYALVGDDIVLMAAGSKLVVDIIEDVMG